jgi:serine-type D-Ala-D-Ala carboxypeptidase (penicillin-binding protein 5/6)
MSITRLFCSVGFAMSLQAVAFGQGPAAAAYSVVDNGTGYVLESANAQKKLQVGSLTKLATAMVVLDWSEAHKVDLGQLATVPQSAAAIPTVANAVPFQAGDRCSLRDLLYAALLQSDNRAAQTLAAHVGRELGEAEPVTGFVVQMNALASKIGMTRTRFLNPHGLDDTERSAPYSTAEDMAKLARYAMERAAFRFYVSQRERKIMVQSAAGAQPFMLRNTNELLGTDNIDGVKTGTTRKAGQCVIISAARPPESRQEGEQHFITPRRIIVVVLGAAERFGTARSLLASGWQKYDAWAAAGRPLGVQKKR